MIVLDSSFLISFYLSEDSNHENALELASKNKNEIMLLSEIILQEALTVLTYKRDALFAKEAYSELISNKNIRYFNFTEIEKEEILQNFFDQKVKFSFPDVSVLYLAGKSKSKILAFDAKMIKLSKS